MNILIKIGANKFLLDKTSHKLNKGYANYATNIRPYIEVRSKYRCINDLQNRPP